MQMMSLMPRYAPAPMRGVGEYFTPNALGEYFQAAASPGLTGLGMLCPNGCGIGLGQDEPVLEMEVPVDSGEEVVVENGKGAGLLVGAGAATVLVVGVGVLALGGFLSYQAGKAMSPPGKNWGWWGVPGMLFGVPWFGVMGLLSNTESRR